MKRLLSAVAAMAALWSPASAAPDEIPWSYAPCIENPILGGLHWDASGRLLVMNGEATQCGTRVANGGYRLAYYSADATNGHAAGYNVRLFESPEQEYPREFGAAVLPQSRNAAQYGVCMLGAGDVRLTCKLVTVVPATTTGPPSATVASLATDDPLVTKDVTMGVYTGAVAPPPPPKNPVGNCGTCF